MQQTKPLKGIRILDFTRLLPGPLGTHMLGELGAEIIKVESPKRMDYTRFYDPKIEGVSTMFHAINANKTSLIVNYETEEGYQQIVEEIKKADILVEQFRPGAMAGFNLSFEEVKKINPNIVYVSVTGYGQSGVNKDKAGHDVNYLAETGLLSLNKDENGKPVIPGFQVADIAGGSLTLVSACTSALLAQKIQNKPQFVDVSLFDATLSLGTIAHGMFQGGLDYLKMPFLSGMMVNYNVYKCADNKWIALGAFELKFWNSFCDMVDKPGWKATKDQELVDGVFDKKKLEDLFKTKTRDEWIKQAEDFDICFSPILEMKEVYEQQHTLDREIFTDQSINDHQNIAVYSKLFKTYS